MPSPEGENRFTFTHEHTIQISLLALALGRTLASQQRDQPTGGRNGSRTRDHMSASARPTHRPALSLTTAVRSGTSEIIDRTDLTHHPHDTLSATTRGKGKGAAGVAHSLAGRPDGMAAARGTTSPQQYVDADVDEPVGPART